jgi:hypothetical protein
MAVNKKTFETNTNLIVSISAIVISLGSLFFNYIQTDLIAKQQKASVLPYLEISNTMNKSFNKISLFRYEVSNNGLGPAFIKNVSVIYEGKEIKDTDVVSFLSKKGIINNFTSSSVSKGAIIPSGKTIEHLILTDTIVSNKVSDLFSEEKLKLKIQYASVYDELWEVTGFNNPKKIKD